jgi:methionine biosynthesis protein MetW
MTNALDTPGINDNRCYDYTGYEVIQRAEYPIIISWIPSGARVIDLGCGNGSLLALLKHEKKIHELGIELTQSGVNACLEKNLNVQQGIIDRPIEGVADREFDYAICNVTLQMVMYPEVLLSEMARISKHQIISFPNFAHLQNRLDLLVHGRMPRPKLYGYTWHDTGHIHQLSVRDFLDFIDKMGLVIEKQAHLGRLSFWGLPRWLPNLFSSTAIYQTRRDL